MVILDGEKELRMQITALMAEQKVRMEYERIESAVLLVHGLDRMHDILVDDDTLSRFQRIGGVIGDYFGKAVIDDQDLHLFMPVPAYSVHVGFTQVEVRNGHRVIQCSKIFLYIEIVIGFDRIFPGRRIRERVVHGRMHGISICVGCISKFVHDFLDCIKQYPCGL